MAASPEESHEVEKRTGAHPLQRQAEEVAAVQPEEGKVVWRPHNQYLKGPTGKLERDSVRSSSNRTRSNAYTLILKVHSNSLTFYDFMINPILEESHSYKKIAENSHFIHRH